MSPDPNDEYFADGMTEEMITTLSSLKELTVIARTSVMQYKKAPKRIADIGRELSAGTLVEGSVRKAGNKVRITIQLIDASNEGHLWAQNYDRQLDDVFTVQSQVAQKVAEALKLELVESERRKIEGITTRNPEAHNTYLKGMFYWNKRTPEALGKAVEFFEQSVKMDPNFAQGYAGLAQAYNVMAGNYYEDPEAYFPKAREYALKALSKDNGLAEAHAVLAFVIGNFDRNLDGEETEIKKAIELNPNYPTAHQWYAQLLGCENRLSEAWTEVNKALELNPLSLIINTNIVDGCYYMKEFTAGIEHAKKVIEMDPNFSAIYPSMIETYLQAGMNQEALKAAETYARMVSQAEANLIYALIFAHVGRKEEAEKLLSELERVYITEHASPYDIARVYFRLGENDKGFDWLEKAYERHDRYLFLMGISYELEGVRSDPRFLSMLGKIGLAGRIKT